VRLVRTLVGMSRWVSALHRLVRAVVRSSLFAALLAAAVVDCWIRRPRVGAEGAVWIHGWCRRIVGAMGFACSVEGRLPEGGAVVSNHLSYLDILLYSSVQPFVMVAKTEVRRWPLLGSLTAQAGTVYVERGGLSERVAGAVLSGGDDHGWRWRAAVSARAVSFGVEQRRCATDFGFAVFAGGAQRER
jgi:1-acyl-sn-glycerol-3-phosphate acyltransferase